jgi:hypothetical protein
MKPGGDSDRGGAERSGADQPRDDEKVFDFYHQHFGVKIKSSAQDARSSEASGRASYNSRTEVADKDESPKSDSWHALKRLIRYQTSGTAPDDLSSFGTTGNTFEAQWFGKAAEISAPGGEDSDSASQFKHTPEGIRLKWTPIVDNVAESGESDTLKETPATELNYQTVAHQSYEQALLATARGEHSPLPDTTSIIEQSTVVHDQDRHENTSEQIEIVDAIVVSDSSDQLNSVPGNNNPDIFFSDAEVRTSENFEIDKAEASVDDAEAKPESADVRVDDAETTPGSAGILAGIEHDSTSKSEINPDQNDEGISEAVLGITESVAVQGQTNDVGVSKVSISEDDDISPDEVAEARSKFGSINAFEVLQKRTKARAESTKAKAEITGDISDDIKEATASGNWDTLKSEQSDSAEAVPTVMNQWCSQSTGESLPTLDELDSIPTPSVLNSIATPNVFSPGSPTSGSVSGAENIEGEEAPDVVPESPRSSWLKAASEYSASVIKAVTEQMKMLSAKPKKETSQTTEVDTAELKDPAEDNSTL